MGRTNKFYNFIAYGNFSDENIEYLKQDTGNNDTQLIRNAFERLQDLIKGFNGTEYEIGIIENTITFIKVICSKQKFSEFEIRTNKNRIKRRRAELINCREESKLFKKELLSLINKLDEIILDKNIDPDSLRELVKKLIDKKEDVNIIKKFLNINKEAIVDSVELFDIVFNKALESIQNNSRDIFYYITLLKIVYTSKINVKEYHNRLMSIGKNKWKNEIEYIINGLRRPYDTERVLNKYDIVAEPQEYSIINIKKTNHNEKIITLDEYRTNLRDDAISITKDGNLYIVKIYVTDVGGIIKPNSPADLVARNNFKCICLPDNRIDIFNPAIETRLSLNENQPRKVMALTVVFTNDGKIVDYHLNKENIIVKKNLTYSQGDRIIRSLSDDEFYNDLNDLKTLANTLRLANKAKKEYWHKKDAIKDNSIHLFESDIIVGELMHVYNKLLPRIASDNHSPYVYRTQEKEYITSLMKELNIEINDWTKNIINGLYLDSKYSSVPRPHHGLREKKYSHSSAPARRYVDTYNQYLTHQFYFKDIPEFFDSETFDDMVEYFNQRDLELSLMNAEYIRAFELKRK